MEVDKNLNSIITNK